MTENERKEKFRLEYSDKDGVSIHVTNEGLESLASELEDGLKKMLGGSPFIKAVSKAASEMGVEMPEMPPMPPVRAAKRPPEPLAITEDQGEAPKPMGAMEPITDGPWQDVDAPGPKLTPLTECKHGNVFLAKDVDAVLNMVIKLGYKKTHLGQWKGAGFYCADCLNKLEPA